MPKTVRLLGKPPSNGAINFREKYLESNRDISFTMKQPADFYTGIFAWGGSGRNTAILPYSSKDITFSSQTIFGNATLQFSTSSGESQSIQLNGVRRLGLLDTELNIARTYRSTFGTRLPRLPSASMIQWKTSKLWNGAVPDDQVDTITGSSNGNNNFYLNRANVDTILVGSRSSNATDTLFLDEYLSDENVDFFARNRGRANIRIESVDSELPQSSNGESEEQNGDERVADNNRTAVFKTRSLEKVVFRDTYFERNGRAWVEIKNTLENPLGGIDSVPLSETNIVTLPLQKGIFQPLPDIFL